MRRPALLAAVALAGGVAAPALAHEGNPNFESIVTSVEGVSGVSAQILNGDVTGLDRGPHIDAYSL